MQNMEVPDTKEASCKSSSSTVANEDCLEQTTMQISSNNETEVEVTHSEYSEVTDGDTKVHVDGENSPHFTNDEDGAVGGTEEQSKAVQNTKGSSAGLLQLAEQAFRDPQESGPIFQNDLRQLAVLRPRLWGMIQFALKERYPGQMGNGGQMVAASAPTVDSRVSNIIALAVQMTDDLASLESDLKAQLHDGQSRKTISIAQDRKKKMDLNMVSELHKYCRDLVSRTSTMLTSIEEDKDQVASSEFVLNEEVPLMNSLKKKASETDDRGSVAFHAEKVFSAIDKEKMTGDTSLTKREFPMPVVSSLSATIGCSVVPIPIPDMPKLYLNSDNSDLEKELHKITKPAFAQEMRDPSQKEISEINQNKKDGDFDKDFGNNSDGQKHFPGSSSQHGQSLPSHAFFHDESIRHGTPETNLSLQVGPHKSYEELHFGRPPEEKSVGVVAGVRRKKQAEAATQTSEQDLLRRYGIRSCRSVMTQCCTVTDVGQPSEEEGAMGGAVCPSGQGGGCMDDQIDHDYSRSPDPTNQAHSTQRDAIGELIVEEQDEEFTIAPQFAAYGPPAFRHLENDSYPRRSLYDFEGPEELYELHVSAPSPPPSLDLEEQLTQFHAQGCRVEILDTDGHTLLNTLLAAPRLVQNQALQISTRVFEQAGLRDFTLRWPGGDLIPWNTILGLPSDQGSSSGPTTVTVQVQSAQDGEGEWRVSWTEGHDPILQPPDNQEENTDDSNMQACLLEGFHGQQHEASSTAQSGQAGPVQPLTVQPDTAGEQECGDSRCTICKEVRGQLVHTPCRHLFHPDCLYHWLAETDSCPNCRKPVNKCREN